MAKEILFKDENGNQLLPKTKAGLVVTDDGSTAEAKLTQVGEEIGDISTLETTADNIVDAINEVNEKAGSGSNFVSISKWNTNALTPLTLAVGEVGYDAPSNKLYIGKDNGTAIADLEEVTMKSTIMYYYKGNSYKYNPSTGKLEYINGTVQTATVGDTSAFSATTAYSKGDLVEKDGTIYEAKEDVTAAAWDETKFGEYVLAEKVKEAQYWVTPQMFGAKADGVDDDTQPIKDALSNGNVYFPKGNYLISQTLEPNSNSVLSFSPEAEIGIHPDTVANACVAIFQIVAKSDIIFNCNGAKFVGSTDITKLKSHIFRILGSNNITINDADISINAVEKDGIYIGANGDSSTCKNIIVRGGKIHSTGRCGIAVVMVDGCLIENVELYDNVNGAPACGVDIEANNYYPNKNITVRGCNVHDNGTFGIEVAWGQNVLVENNVVSNNFQKSGKSTYGDIHAYSFSNKTSAAGCTDGEHRFKVTNIAADGWITLEDVGVLKADDMVYFPSVVAKHPASDTGASKNLQTYYYISTVDSANNKIKITQFYGYDAITSFTDINLTDNYYIILFCEDLTSNVTIRNNVVNSMTIGAGIGKGISCDQVVNAIVEGNKIKAENYALEAHSFGMVVRNNEFTRTNETGSVVPVCFPKVVFSNNTFHGGNRSLVLNGASYGGTTIDGCTFDGCSNPIYITGGKGLKISNSRFVPKDANTTALIASTTSGFTGGELVLDNCNNKGCKSTGNKGYSVAAGCYYEIDGSIGYDGNVVNYNPKKTGTTDGRPTSGIYIGWGYFDTTLGKPVYAKTANGSQWVDATGTVV